MRTAKIAPALTEAMPPGKLSQDADIPYDIEKPPLVVAQGVDPVKVNDLTEAWQSFPEHIRHLIHSGGATIALKPLDGREHAMDTGAKCIAINSEKLLPWRPDTPDLTHFNKQGFQYGRAIYGALVLAQPQLAEGIDLSVAQAELESKAPTIQDVLGIAHASDRANLRSDGNAEVERPREILGIYNLINGEAEDLAYGAIDALKKRLGDREVHQRPPIRTHIEKYGVVEPKDIDRFMELYNQVPQAYRDLIEDRGVTFLLGDDRVLKPQKDDDEKRVVRISTSKLYAAEIEAVRYQRIWIRERLGGTIPKPDKKTASANKSDTPSNRSNEIGIPAIAVAIGIALPPEVKQSALRALEQDMRKRVASMTTAGISVPPESQEARDAERMYKEHSTSLFSIIGTTASRLDDPMMAREARDKRPLEVAFYEQFVDAVDREYAKIDEKKDQRRVAECTAKYKADEKLLAINAEPEGLTQPQQEYWRHVNNAIAILRVTPGRFDEGFRVCAALHVATPYPNIANHVHSDVNARSRRYQGRHPHAAVQFLQPINELSLKVSPRMTGTYNNPAHHDLGLDPASADKQVFRERAEKMSHDLLDHSNAVAAAAYEALASCGLPVSHYLHQSKHIPGDEYSEGKKGFEKLIERAGAPEKAPDIANMLQQFASGEIPMHRLAAVPQEYTFDGLTVTLPNCAELMHGSLVEVAQRMPFAQEKVTPAMREAALEELKLAHRLLPEALKSRATWTMDRAEEEERKPYSREPYVLREDQPTAQKLAREGSPLVEPLLRTLSIRIPLHEQLGNAIFAEPLMQLADAYAANDIPQLKRLVADSGVKEAVSEAKRVIDAVRNAPSCERIQDNADGASIPLVQIRHHTDTLRVLAQSADLMACLNGAPGKRISDAEKPEPYRLPATSTPRFPRGSDEAIVAETQRLCEAMDSRIIAHRHLGDILFTGPLSILITAVAGQQDGRIRAALDEDKNEGIVAAIETAKTYIGAVLSQKNIPRNQREAYGKLSKALIKSPTILACLTGSQDEISARAWQQQVQIHQGTHHGRA